jgi:hypothetical protein
MKRSHKWAAIIGICVLFLFLGRRVLLLVDRWFIAPYEPPRIVVLESRIESNLADGGALGIGEHPRSGNYSDRTIRVGARWLDDDRLHVVVQRKNLESMVQVELWLSFQPPNAPLVQARAGSMPLGGEYTLPLIHPRGSIVTTPDGTSFSRTGESGTLVFEYELEGQAGGSPQRTRQKIKLESGDLR